MCVLSSLWLISFELCVCVPLLPFHILVAFAVFVVTAAAVCLLGRSLGWFGVWLFGIFGCLPLDSFVPK